MLVAVCSLKGSPGVTTFSVALAARWPSPARCVLVECDPSGGDVAIRFGLASSPGLMSLAAAARRSSDPELLWQHAQALPGGLPVVAAPPGAEHAVAAVAALVPEGGDAGVLGVAARVPEAVVIADCGRVDPGSAVLSVVRGADVMLLLSRAHVDDLAHLATRLTVVSRWSSRPGLLLVGEGHSGLEVSRELGVPVMGRIPEDSRGAAVLRGRRRGGRGPSRSALGRSAAGIARMLLREPPARPGPEPLGGSRSESVPAPRAAPVPVPLPSLSPPEATSRNGSRP